MATLLSRSAWAKISVFRKKWPFSPSKLIYIEFFWLEFEISASALIPVPNFSSIGQKNKGSRILTWNNTKNGLMTSYVPPGDDVSKIFMGFDRFCPRVPSCQFWL